MKRYLTTPIYYASGAPHPGHAYTTLVADSYKRFYRLLGDDVMLITGTDEHGQKIERAAAAAGTPVVDFVDARSGEFEALWHALDIDVDFFERTTRPAHRALATAFWQRLAAREDIYRGEYEGLYCVDCEQYFTEGDTCPVHRKPLERFSEPSWFFRLSRYRDALIRHIESHPRFILPAARRNEVLAFLNGNALRDLAISRTSTRWGIPVPGDSAHVMYVWVDALVAYLSALSPDGVAGLDEESLQAWWRQTTHFIGKDILTFHAVYWPALLMAADLPLPQSIVVNGWLTVEGRKIAKSDPATMIDPAELAATVGPDGLKLYFLKSVSLGQDLDFNRAQLVHGTNTDLANNIGNLFSRFTALGDQHFAGEWQRQSALPAGDRELLATLAAAAGRIAGHFEQAEVAQAAREFVEAAARVNSFIQQAAPWQIPDRERLATLMWTLHHTLADLTLIGMPFVPETMARARAALCLSAPPAWRDVGRTRDVVATRHGAPLYPRIKAAG